MLREFALGLPQAWEDFPWEDDRTAKVGKKVFAFLGPAGEPGDDYRFSVKLPDSAEQALALRCCEPTGYGLGRANWVTISVGAATARQSRSYSTGSRKATGRSRPRRSSASWMPATAEPYCPATQVLEDLPGGADRCAAARVAGIATRWPFGFDWPCQGCARSQARKAGGKDAQVHHHGRPWRGND